MTWRRLLFSLAALLAALSAMALDTDSVAVSPTPEERHATAEWLQNLCPRAATVQMWGNMGLASGGATWIYGHARHWETSLMAGFVRKHSSEHAKATLTLKQDYIPWTMHLSPRLAFRPLTVGAYVNGILHSDLFWTHQPSRYPKGYYWFSTRWNVNMCLGERLSIALPRQHRLAGEVTLFYELSTCDYKFIQFVHNHYVTPGKMLSLSLGAQFSWR